MFLGPLLHRIHGCNKINSASFFFPFLQHPMASLDYLSVQTMAAVCQSPFNYHTFPRPWPFPPRHEQMHKQERMSTCKTPAWRDAGCPNTSTAADRFCVVVLLTDNCYEGGRDVAVAEGGPQLIGSVHHPDEGDWMGGGGGGVIVWDPECSAVMKNVQGMITSHRLNMNEDRQQTNRACWCAPKYSCVVLHTPYRECIHTSTQKPNGRE